MASSTSRARTIAATGPKVSSRNAGDVERHVGQHRRLVEEPGAGARPPAEQHRAPAATERSTWACEVVANLRRRQRPDCVLLVHRIADDERLHALDELRA